MSLARVQEYADELAAKLECPVAVNDFALDLIAASPHIEPVDEYRVSSIMRRHTPPDVVELLRDQSVLRRTEPFMFEGKSLPGAQARMCVPLVDAGFPIAYIWILLGERRLHKKEMGMVRLAAKGMLRELIAMRNPEDDRLLLDSRKLQAVVSADPFSAEYAISALIADGVVRDLRKPAVVVFEFSNGKDASQSQDTQATFRPIHERARRSWAQGALLGIAEGRLVAVCPSSDAPLLVAAARAKLEAQPDGAAQFTSVGWSTCEDPALGLRETFDEARFAAWVAKSVNEVGPQADYSDLGAFIALRKFPTTEASVALLSKEAAELRHRDSHVYAGTVLTLLNCAGDVHDTCTALSIHRTTLYYRLERVRALIGDALDVGWKRTSIHLGLLMGTLVDAES